MKTIPVLLFSAVSCLSLPHLSQGQALPFQKSPPPGAPMPVAAPPSPSTSTTASVPEGFVMRDGTVYAVKNGTLTRVTQEQVLRIAPNGTITGFEGQTWQIPTGQMMTLDGRMVAVDPSVLNSTQPTRADAAVSGENLSGLAPSTPAAGTTSGSSSTQASGSDAFTQVPDTRGKRSTGSMRGSGSNTQVDAFGNTIVIDRPQPPGQQNGNQQQPIILPGNGNSGTIDRRYQPATGQNNNSSPARTTTPGSTNTNTTRTGTSTDANTTESSSTATPNQQFSTGTSINPNATGASSAGTPNQLNSSGTNTGPNSRTTPPRPATPNQLNSSGTNTTTNPNATKSGTGSTGSTGTGTTSTSGSSSTGTGTSGGGATSSGGSSSSGSSGSGSAR